MTEHDAATESDDAPAAGQEPPPSPPVLEYASPRGGEATRGQKIAWILYDWANSGYGLIFGGPLFTTVFIAKLLPRQPDWPRDPALPPEATVTGLTIGGSQVGGDSVLALLVALVAFLTCVAAPVLGALADLRGLQKSLFVAFATTGSILAMSAGLLLPGDGGGRWVLAAVLYVS